MNVKCLRLRESDLPMVMDWRMRPYITRYMNTDPQLTLDGQRRWFERLNSDDSQLHWVVTFDDNPIGMMNVVNIDRTNSRCSWGYYVAEREYRSLKLALYLEWNLYDYVFDVLKLHKLCNETFVENEQVVQLHQLCGSRQDGVMRDHIFKNGKFYDVSVGSILADEWFSMRSEIEYEKFLFEGAQPPPFQILIINSDRSSRSFFGVYIFCVCGFKLQAFLRAANPSSKKIF